MMLCSSSRYSSVSSTLGSNNKVDILGGRSIIQDCHGEHAAVCDEPDWCYAHEELRSPYSIVESFIDRRWKEGWARKEG
jgi:hypothetical protein